MIKRLSCFVVLALCFSSVIGQDNPPKYEMRGAWMATVANLDWPASGSSSVSSQQADLITKLDRLKAAGINLVFFQVRTEGDALYDSDIEPWSRFLTGQEGVTPDPYWDPLEFAVTEAHKRGMELHAWLNPYRAMRSIPSDFTQKRTFSDEQPIDESLRSFLAKEYNPEVSRYKDTDQRDSMHVSNTHPEWLLVVNNYAIFDPGLPEVMDYTVDVVMDIVNRYDVDGIHFDDYFYPYPPDHMTSGNPDLNALDDETFEQYPRGYTNKEDWRRNNVNLLVEMVYDSINTVKPWVEFGISPFGIWKSGTPSGTFGMSAYSTIYADALAWLESQTIDYVNPQLYWKIGGGQDFVGLSNWWAEQASANNRHIYAGHGLYKASSTTYTGSTFSRNEIPRQIRHTRSNPDIGGSIYFRTKNITDYSTQGFADSLKNNYYRYAALPPVMDWKDSTKPASPQNLLVDQDDATNYKFHLTWDEVEFTGADVPGSIFQDSLVKYAIYRVDSDTIPVLTESMQDARNLIAVTGVNNYIDTAPPSAYEYYYFVTAVSRNSIESNPSVSQLAGQVIAGSIHLSPGNITIDTTMAFSPDYEVLNEDNNSSYVARDKITWSLTNPEVGEISEIGKFTPISTGETGIVAKLNVVSDTVWVNITSHEGYHTLDNFADMDSWNLETVNMDTSQFEITDDQRGGIQVHYTIPANTSNVEIRFLKDIPIDGVPGFANIRTSGDTSGVEMSIDVSNADGQFRMINSTLVDFAAPDVIHYPFQSSKVNHLTPGASFYFPFALNSLNVKLPDNETDEAVAGYFNIFEVGVSYTETPVSNEPDELTDIPSDVRLHQNYPNPFNPSTSISFNLPSAGKVNLEVFDIIGRKVATVVSGRLNAGLHTYNFDASALSSGIYLYRLQTERMTLSRKMTLIK